MKKKATPKSRGGSPSKSQRAAAAASTKCVTAPVSKGFSASSSAPRYSSKSDGTIRIQRREFVRTMTNGAATDFVILDPSSQEPGLDLNPANALLFPWLAGIADRYERYRFHSISIELLPAQATSTAGRIYAAVDYDYDDAVPKTKSEVLAYRTAREGPVWDRLVMSMAPDQLHPDNLWKFVSSNAKRNFVEPRTSYCGYILIATEATANCKFDLWITYDVSLTCPEPQIQGQYATVTPPAVYTDLPIVPTIGDVDAGGGVFAQLIKDSFSVLASQLVQRVCGNGDIPKLINGTLFPGGNVIEPPTCYDLQGMGGKGTITWQAFMNRLGDTPNQLLAAMLPRIGYMVYDSKGSFIGYGSSGDTGTGSPGGAAPAVANGWAVANTPTRVVATSNVYSILATWATARFIAAYVMLAQSYNVNSPRFSSGYKLSY